MKVNLKTLVNDPFSDGLNLRGFLQKQRHIDRMDKWRQKMYSFVFALIRLTSLAIE